MLIRDSYINYGNNNIIFITTAVAVYAYFETT